MVTTTRHKARPPRLRQREAPAWDRGSECQPGGGQGLGDPADLSFIGRRSSEFRPRVLCDPTSPATLAGNGVSQRRFPQDLRNAPNRALTSPVWGEMSAEAQDFALVVYPGCQEPMEAKEAIPATWGTGRHHLRSSEVRGRDYPHDEACV